MFSVTGCQEVLSEAPFRRLRRNRKSAAIRELLAETTLLPAHCVAPIFLVDAEENQLIASMPEVLRHTIDSAVREVVDLWALGVRAVALFPVVAEDKKDFKGSEALRDNNLAIRAIRAIKAALPDLCVMVDVALDPYTSHGHDGLVGSDGIILNDPTIAILGDMALSLAAAGVDVVAPSDMMDGRIAHIRQSLDRAGYQEVSILAYAAKYASALYAPFREALGSAPRFGDKKTYQLDPANVREALLEAATDELEGADMLLVKPALPYLDVVAKLRGTTLLPIGAYHVSGEYSMVMAAAAQGWLDADRVFAEQLLGVRRAGANFILTYAARRIARLFQ